jgi:hypothetical protein
MNEMAASGSFMHSRETRAKLSSALQRYIDADRLSIEVLADATGVSVSTARRWVVGELLPDVHEIRALSACPSIDLDIRLAIGAVAFADTPLRVGAVDVELPTIPQAVRDGLRHAVQSASLAERVAEACSDNFIDSEEATDILSLIASLKVPIARLEARFDRDNRGPRAAAG